MNLLDLIARLPGAVSGTGTRTRRAASREVRGLTPHLRDVRPGMAFFALPEALRANPYAIQAACERGAAVVVCDDTLSLPARTPAIRVPDPQAAFATAAAAFRAYPARHLRLIAVTGDPAWRSGVAAALAHVLDALDLPAAVLGQQGFMVAGRTGAQTAGDLDAGEINTLLAQHLGSQGRCVIVEFDGDRPPEGFHGLEFQRQIQVDAPVQWAHFHPLLLNPRGSRVELRTAPGPVIATTPLTGRRSLQALDLAWTHAVELAVQLGRNVRSVAHTLPVLRPIRGWLEPVHCGQPFGVLIEGATSAAALIAALNDARELTRGRLLLVLGAPADRSPEERSALGAAARTLADHVFVTADNPRQRSVKELSADWLPMAAASGATLEPDRAEAIALAIRTARAGDVVVLAGKAFRPVQELADVVVPFDDREVAAQALNRRGYRGGEY